ncbi:MAG: M42 family peptidase [Lactobacillus sp.]|jgi:putative aminopeptidase FrvX|uniref:M42 family metallopeptidase n=1 Tax=Lacticaseibacillus suilingensis TaxID=2799577 RepID=A0ABW4BEA7_9LACO|nr:M42 family peptidase [Lacticaseibacillus suilingensis]MCI1893312.1 M42 family peptidase [Lactobacillus sp.]MCI1940497.1 M42 family peptidase [Lactobacillus sp.]MCI1971098.1 M42 family peptidase [Lactobacillus sp.]MCI2038299.1 M42 family peptidase [Lactobacillus sp.]
MDKQQQIELVKQFSDAYGVPGFEQDVIKLYRDQMAPYGTTTIDGMFNALTARHGNTGDRPVVQMDAHADEVGLMVQAIRPSGLIKFVTLGGWVPTNVPAMRVVVRNKRGEYIPGVVATKPPHFMTAAERNQVPTIAGMSIDVGSVSSEETINDFAIDTGCPIFPDVQCSYDDQHGMFFGKAFDDRVGAAALIDTFDNLKDDQLKVDVVAGLSTQEEVGLRGAYVTARKVDPDLAIVYEGVPADDTFEPDWLSQTRMKGGPMLRDLDTTYIANPNFQQFAADLADELHLPYTRAVRTGGGQNGAAIGYWKGVPTIVVGIPVRYEHTAYNFTALSDFQVSSQLGTEILRRLDKETIESFNRVD